MTRLLDRVRPFLSRLPLAVGALCAVVACLPGCSSSAQPASSAPGCEARLTGNLSDAVALPAGCGALQAATDGGSPGGYLLSFRVSSSQMAALSIDVNIGDSPSPGQFSSETVVSWSVLGVRSGNSDCAYAAGSDAVPNGSFMLHITGVEGASAGGDGTAHGMLDVVMYLHAPPSVDCGAGDVENVEVVF